jgi:hypothetical protein
VHFDEDNFSYQIYSSVSPIVSALSTLFRGWEEAGAAARLGASAAGAASASPAPRPDAAPEGVRAST